MFPYLENKVVKEIMSTVHTLEYPPDAARKTFRNQLEKGRSVRTILRGALARELVHGGWTKGVRLYDDSSLPGAKLHFLKDRVGIVWSLGHRTTIGTDLLRMQRAYSTALNMIDFGVFICGTKAFESHYFGTKKQKKENMATYEEVLGYLEMTQDIIDVPIVIMGLKPPDTESRKLS